MRGAGLWGLGVDMVGLMVEDPGHTSFKQPHISRGSSLGRHDSLLDVVAAELDGMLRRCWSACRRGDGSNSCPGSGLASGPTRSSRVPALCFLIYIEALDALRHERAATRLHLSQALLLFSLQLQYSPASSIIELCSADTLILPSYD